MREDIEKLVDAILHQHEASGKKKRNNKIKTLVLSIGICAMFIAILFPSVPGGEGTGWNKNSNPPHMFNTNTGNIGIGTEHPDYILDVVGNRIRLNETKNSSSKTIELRTDGAAVDVNAYNADLFLHSWTGNTILQAFGGKVGIGTGAPEAELHIKDAAGHADLMLESNGGTKWNFGAANDRLFFATYFEGWHNYMIIENDSGNVGIGAVPEYQLDVVGDEIRLRDSTDPTAKQALIRTDGAAVDVCANNADLFLHSYTGNTLLQPFYGRVGIGTINPEYQLDVVGDEIRLRNSTASSAKQIMVRTDGAAVDVNAYNADLFLHSWTGNTILQAFGGKVGIGTGAPEAELHIKDATGHADLMLESNGGTKWNFGASHDKLFFATYFEGWHNYMIIENDSGRVGIGNLFPVAKLDVYTSTSDEVAIQGVSSDGIGVKGDSTHGIGVEGYSEFGSAIYGWTDFGLAGNFSGDVKIDGDLEVTGTINGGIITPTYNVKEIYSNYDVEDTDYTLFVNATDDTITINLPPASENEGRIMVIKKIGPAPYWVYISAYSGDSIEAIHNLNIWISSVGGVYTLQSDGDHMWYIIGHY